MRQNITIATMRALQNEQEYYFFRNMRLLRNTLPRAGYMSKDGTVAWFWVKDFETKAYKIYVFHKNGIVYHSPGNITAGVDYEASEQCRLRCEAYDRDKTLVNPTLFEVPKEIPRENRRDYEHNRS